MKRVILLQLPIQGYDFFFSHENIPLAPAYLHAIAFELGIEAEILPDPLMSYGSDQAILRYILKRQPDLVGMSCYLWNVERSLFLAREIKKHLPSCLVVLGGPEVNPENHFLLRHPDFDLGVVGEGERTWRAILQSYPDLNGISGLLLRKENGRWEFTGYPHPTQLSQIPSPLLNGNLQSHLKKVLWMETVRGCVNRCAYCFYHKRYPGVRAFPLERVFREIEKARALGLREVVFLDPCWNRHPELKGFLERLSEMNSDHRLELHAEGEAEAIDSWTAERMREAGFAEMEVGVQSVKKETLQRLRRRFEPERFLKGVSLLQRYGIEVMVDLIAGLPGEDLSDILKSLDWVIEHEAYDFLMLYPLSLLPSTELYERAQEFGLRAMPHPPYLITKTSHLNASEIHQAFLEYEKRMEEDISPLEIPPALDPRVRDISFLEGLCHQIFWNQPEEIDDLISIADKTTYGLTITISRKVLRRAERWSPILRGYLKENPFSLLSVEVPFDSSLEELRPLWELAREHCHPIDRDFTVTHTPYRSFLLFSRQKGLIWKWPDPREYEPFSLPDGQKISYSPVCLVASSERNLPGWFFEEMERRYLTLPEIRLWSLLED